MKEIKAYIRRSTVTEAARRLQAAGASGISILQLHPVGYGYEPNYFESQFEDPFRRYRHLRVVKLEGVCRDADAATLLCAIQQACQTRAPGDGTVFVTEVLTPIRIRDSAANEDIQ